MQVKQPMFGANFVKGDVISEPDGMLSESVIKCLTGMNSLGADLLAYLMYLKLIQLTLISKHPLEQERWSYIIMEHES